MNRLLPPQSEALRTCPRCRYTGEGIAYFRRPGKLVLLMGVSLFTYGVGGVVYWLVRRGRLVCPNCGMTWHDQALALTPFERPRSGRPLARREELLPSSGMKRRTLGILLLLLAAIAIVVGIAEFEPVMIAGGSAIGLGGTGFFLWGLRSLHERRAALTEGLQRRVLQLATRKGGTLTVTEAAAELDLSIAAAEGVLNGMDDGFRVRSEVTEEGIVLFEFPEVQHQHRRLATGDPPPDAG